MIEAEPKILVISNNAFSSTNNNGKTLASFFKSFKSKNIAQLYFNSELPTDDYFKNFFQISDISLLKSILFKNEKSGKIVYSTKNNDELNLFKKNSTIKFGEKILVNSNLARFSRELLWKIGNWKTFELTEWVEHFSPDIIFLCAGDSEFAYQIASTLKRELKSKLITYITDDYILPRNTKNLFWWLRRNRILIRLKRILEISDLFITISTKMSNVYSDSLGKKSIVLLNMTGSLKKEIYESFEKDTINLVYAGGLHLNRHKTLILLANAINKYNISVKGEEKKAFLQIYSNNKPEKKIIKNLDIPNASKFCGNLKSSELIEVLNHCDIPVHVESFDKKSIYSTLLSISTKISEYLSLEKPILAIGPKEVASMEYLSEIAFCIYKPNHIFEGIQKLFTEHKLRSNLGEISRQKYHINHDHEKNTTFFRQEIMRIYDKTI